MTAENNNKHFTILSVVAVLLLLFYFLDAVFGTRDLASITGDSERAAERKEAKIAIKEEAKNAAPAIEAAKKIVLDEWGTDSNAGYEAFKQRVESKYPTPEPVEEFE